jgi:hypothetical protein
MSVSVQGEAGEHGAGTGCVALWDCRRGMCLLARITNGATTTSQAHNCPTQQRSWAVMRVAVRTANTQYSGCLSTFSLFRGLGVQLSLAKDSAKQRKRHNACRVELGQATRSCGENLVLQ